MKTFRLFFATMAVLFLTIGISCAQGKKTSVTYTYPWSEFFPVLMKI